MGLKGRDRNICFISFVSASVDSTSNRMVREFKWSYRALPQTDQTHIHLKRRTMKCTGIYWKKTLNCIQLFFEVKKKNHCCYSRVARNHKGGNPVKKLVRFYLHSSTYDRLKRSSFYFYCRFYLSILILEKRVKFTHWSKLILSFIVTIYWSSVEVCVFVKHKILFSF